MQLRQRRRRQLRRERDLQGPGPPERVHERARRDRVRVRIRRAVGDRVVEEGRVAHAAREHAVDDEAVPRAQVRRQRHPAALGLQAEQAAVGRRKANRAPAVARERGADQAGGDRRGAAAAGAAGAVCQLPRVARHSPRRRLRPGKRAQLGHVRLADHDRARRTRASDDLRVRLRGLAVGVRAERAHLPGDVEFVLDRDRHAQQRAIAVPRSAPGIGLVGLHPRALVEHHPESVYFPIQTLNPLQIDVHQLMGAQLTGGDQLRLSGDPCVGEVGCVHSRNLDDPLGVGDRARRRGRVESRNRQIRPGAH